MPGRLACFISPGRSIETAVERVRLAERLGYEAVFATHIAARDALITLAAYAAATERIKLGTGVLPAFPRHPVALAQEAATLDEVAGGRLILGIGPSHEVTMRHWYGLPFDRPLAQTKEYVEVLRSLFTTGRVEHAGEFYRARFAFLGYRARADLPIYLAALAPRMLRFAGAAADGVVLWACLPSYVREVVVPNVHAGAREAGRDPHAIEIVAAVPVAVTENPAAARDAFRREFFPYMSLPFYRRAIDGAGFGGEIAAFDEANARGDFEGALRAIGDGMLGEFAGIGSAEDVRAKIAEYRAAGVTLPAAGMFPAGEGSAGAEATLEAAAGG